MIPIPNCVKKEIENRFPREEGDVGVRFKLQNDNKQRYNICISCFQIFIVYLYLILSLPIVYSNS